MPANNPTAFGNDKAVVLHWQVPATAAGIRADQFLVQKVGRLSRSKAQHIINKGDLRTVGGPLKCSKILHGGEKLELWRIPPDEKENTDNYGVVVVYEDEDIVIVNKPPDLAIHPTARYLYKTLTHWLKEHYPDNIPHPCHRLDRETSGLVLCARSKSAESQLKTAFMRGEVEKTYLAIVRGHLTKQQILNWPLGLQGDRGLVRIRMIHDATNGAPSQTIVKPIQFCENTNRSLVQCHPKTGRQHQIRAHLALAGHPIVGDKLYAMGDAYFDAFTKGEANLQPEQIDHSRHALHAHQLAFMLNGRKYQFTQPLPDDLACLI